MFSIEFLNLKITKNIQVFKFDIVSIENANTKEVSLNLAIVGV